MEEGGRMRRTGKEDEKIKPSKLDRPGIKERVVRQLAAGVSQREIAEQVSITPSSVSRFSRREDIASMIEEEAMSLFEAVPDAVSNVKDAIRDYKKTPKGDVKRRALALKESERVLEGAGILNSQGTSKTVINLFQQNNGIPLEVLEILRRNSDMKPDFIDVDFDG
jgi:hypothetical protein